MRKLPLPIPALFILGMAVIVFLQKTVFERGGMPFYCGPFDNNILCQLLRLVGLV